MDELRPTYELQPIGYVESPLKSREDAPKQGSEGAPDAWITFTPRVLEALDDTTVGSEIIVITWFHLSDRNVLKVHPRSDPSIPLTGVFATRSPDRPNPLGLHRVRVKAISGPRLLVGPLEALDGTPVVDIKPTLNR